MAIIRDEESQAVGIPEIQGNRMQAASELGSARGGTSVDASVNWRFVASEDKPMEMPPIFLDRRRLRHVRVVPLGSSLGHDSLLAAYEVVSRKKDGFDTYLVKVDNQNLAVAGKGLPWPAWGPNRLVVGKQPAEVLYAENEMNSAKERICAFLIGVRLAATHADKESVIAMTLLGAAGGAVGALTRTWRGALAGFAIGLSLIPAGLGLALASIDRHKDDLSIVEGLGS